MLWSLINSWIENNIRDKSGAYWHIKANLVEVPPCAKISRWVKRYKIKNVIIFVLVVIIFIVDSLIVSDVLVELFHSGKFFKSFFSNRPYVTNK